MSVNKVILLGIVGKDPIIKNLPSGEKVANFPLATNKRGYKTKDGRDIPEQTEWHAISASGYLANTVEKYVHKRDKIYLEGELHTREYESKGEKKFITEIRVTSIELLSYKRDENSDGQQNDGRRPYQEHRNSYEPKPVSTSDYGDDGEISSEDLPF